MSEPAQTPFLAHFPALRDPRQSAKVLYPLPEILLMLLCATISGADDFVEINLWGNERLGFLRRFQLYEHGIPSHDTLCDIIAAIDPEMFKTCFLAWVEDLRAAPPMSLPLMERHRVAAMPVPRAACPWISSQPGRRANGWFSDRKPCRRNPMKSPPSPCCCNAWT